MFKRDLLCLLFADVIGSWIWISLVIWWGLVVVGTVVIVSLTVRAHYFTCRRVDVVIVLISAWFKTNIINISAIFTVKLCLKFFCTALGYSCMFKSDLLCLLLADVIGRGRFIVWRWRVVIGRIFGVRIIRSGILGIAIIVVSLSVIFDYIAGKCIDFIFILKAQNSELYFIYHFAVLSVKLYFSEIGWNVVIIVLWDKIRDGSFLLLIISVVSGVLNSRCPSWFLADIFVCAGRSCNL